MRLTGRNRGTNPGENPGDRDGTRRPRAVLEASFATGSAITARPDGEVCVIWSVNRRQEIAPVKTACSPSFTVVDSTVKQTMSPAFPVAYRDDGAAGAAALFIPFESSALTGLVRSAGGAWAKATLDAAVARGAGTRALAGSAVGSPFCFAANDVVSVKRWGQTGAGSDIVTLSGQDYATCGLAASGNALAIVGALPSGIATLTTRGAGAGPQAAEVLIGDDVRGYSLAASATHFVVAAYGSTTGLVRARVPVTGGQPTFVPVPLPGGANGSGQIAVAFDAAGTEYLAIRTTDVLVSKTCAP